MGEVGMGRLFPTPAHAINTLIGVWAAGTGRCHNRAGMVGEILRVMGDPLPRPHGPTPAENNP